MISKVTPNSTQFSNIFGRIQITVRAMHFAKLWAACHGQWGGLGCMPEHVHIFMKKHCRQNSVVLLSSCQDQHLTYHEKREPSSALSLHNVCHLVQSPISVALRTNVAVYNSRRLGAMVAKLGCTDPALVLLHGTCSSFCFVRISKLTWGASGEGVHAVGTAFASWPSSCNSADFFLILMHVCTLNIFELNLNVKNGLRLMRPHLQCLRLCHHHLLQFLQLSWIDLLSWAWIFSCVSVNVELLLRWGWCGLVWPLQLIWIRSWHTDLAVWMIWHVWSIWIYFILFALRQWHLVFDHLQFHFDHM